MNIISVAHILWHNKDVRIGHVSFITKFLKIDYAYFEIAKCSAHNLRAKHFEVSKRICRGKIRNDAIRLAVDRPVSIP